MSDEDKKEAPKKAAKAVVFPYTVAKGCCLTSKKGILADGAEVKAEYFPGGKGTLDNLVKKGHVVKAK